MTERRFGCLMALVPENEARPIQDFVSTIPEHILAEDGREYEPHVTVLFGFTGEPTARLQAFLRDYGPLRFTMGRTSRFENQTQDVLKVDIDSDSLHALRDDLIREFDHVADYPDYHPHMTIAYLRPGSGREFDDYSGFEGHTVTVSQLVYSSADQPRVKTGIQLVDQANRVSDPVLSMIGAF